MKKASLSHPIFQLMSVQFKEFFREPGALFWTFVFPILMAWGLGIAFTQKDILVRKVAVLEYSNHKDFYIENFLKKDQATILNRESGLKTYKKFFSNGIEGGLEFHFLVTDSISAVNMIKKGKINLFISSRDSQIIYHLDPANSEALFLQMQLENYFQNGYPGVEDTRIEAMTRVGSRYIDFLIPGLIALGIMNSCLWGISYSLIDKRSKKLLRRMIATPMKKWHFLLAQLFTRVTLTLLETSALVLFAVLYFDLQIQGNFFALIAVILAGNAAFIGIAILISSRTANPHVGGGLINFVTLPMMVLSGIFFSYHNFPDWTIAYIKLLPLTEFADSIRMIFNEGAGWPEVALPIWTLLFSGFATYFLGLKLYKWY